MDAIETLWPIGCFGDGGDTNAIRLVLNVKETPVVE